MTDIQDIADATSAMNQLAEAYNGKIVSIDDRVDGIIGNLNSALSGSFHINAATGNDANDGSENAPFQTVGEALERCVSGGNYELHLHTDVVYDQLRIVRAAGLTIRSNITGTKRRFTIAQERADAPGSTRLPSLQGSGGGLNVYFLDINLDLPKAAAHVAGRYLLHGSTFTNVFFRDSEITRQADADTSLLSGFFGVFAISLRDSSYPATMGGHWLLGIAAGTDPSTVPYLLTRNIATL